MLVRRLTRIPVYLGDKSNILSGGIQTATSVIGDRLARFSSWPFVYRKHAAYHDFARHTGDSLECGVCEVRAYDMLEMENSFERRRIENGRSENRDHVSITISFPSGISGALSHFDIHAANHLTP
jgi:hypothetical protein